jgi:hypothetical protein
MPERRQAENNQMNTSNLHQLIQQTTAEAAVENRTGRAERPSHRAQGRPKRSLGTSLRSLPIRAAAQEVEHLHELERAGESEWTPWIAMAGLILLFAAAGLLMFGIVEGAFHLLASASVEG